MSEDRTWSNQKPEPLTLETLKKVVKKFRWDDGSCLHKRKITLRTPDERWPLLDICLDCMRSMQGGIKVSAPLVLNLLDYNKKLFEQKLSAPKTAGEKGEDNASR